MNRDTHDTRPVDDAELGALIRDVATGWELPPVRLDAPGWRDRVRRPRSQRVDTMSGWLGRVGRAATAAIALTVVAALVAVYLTRPPQSTGKVPASVSPTSSGSAPRASAAPSPTPLPKLFVAGAAPSPQRIVVQTVSASFAAVDLSTGTLGRSLAEPDYGSQVRTLSNGDTVCLCFLTGGPGMANTQIAVSLRRWDARLAAITRGTAPIADVRGQPDPRDGDGNGNAGNLSASATFSPDGAYAYVGWSARQHPDWTSGIVVVRLDTGTIVQRFDLPSVSDGRGASRTYIDAPRVLGRGGDRVVIDRNGYHYSPTTADQTFAEFSDTFSAAVSGDGSLATAVELPDQACDFVGSAGGLADGGLWLSCIRYGQPTTIRRVSAGGGPVGTTAVDTASIDGTTSVVSADGGSLYVWNPISATLTKVDLATGAKTTAQASPGASAAQIGGPLTVLGNWLAPTAAAKMFLNPGIALSPDGGRVYAVGVAGGSINGGDLSGSSGIAVFDAASMRAVATWPVTADYTSIAVNADGSGVFVTGMPGVRGDGTEDRGQSASLTVFDSTTGSIQLIAGDLGSEMLSFAEPVLK